MSALQNNNILIIGGGASGMIAAIAAKRAGAFVTILERNQRVGRKILATGNGRCNLTNTYIDVDRYHGKHPEFVYGPLNSFDYDATIDFFEKLGIAHIVEDEGKVFPMSLQASSVLDVLRYELEDLGVNVVCEAEAADIKKKDVFTVTLKDGRVFKGDKVIIAAGGKASPDLGSNGSGYILAEKLGHKIVNPFPALVQLKLSSKYLKQLSGIKFEGAAEILVKDKVIRREEGEILFTEYGISGPPVLQLSRVAAENLLKNDKVYIKVAIIKDMTKEALDGILLKRFQDGSNKPLSFNFVGFLNKKLVPVILKEAGIDDINKPAGSVSSQERKKLASILTDWRFEVTGTNPWHSAQVTAGGVDVCGIDNKTMESKIVPGLYFAGEVVDIDGDCGGYNLQWAWSSGYVAGMNAANVKF
ncbi:ferredoxin--NADP reductase [Oxobacter pfennigii]|uniref:Ferredoxin--NADP reductase n=1 Tax=Oxobacter pfennigii TaxID=36849 RepID=A0A0P8X5T1_9CLOT|nr:NAD(P)/FAD-dependent oxidoreductase [Oxobacter pfennigii]KPU46239.1 ferredoxin--NADP reductase [Oxobacter pfennigii]